MRASRLPGVIAASAVVTLLIFLPFLPGRYDPLAAPLSGLARAIGFLGLLVVPLGALWLAAEPGRPLAARTRSIGRLAIGGLAFCLLLLTVGALAGAGFILAGFVLLSGAFTLLRAYRNISLQSRSALPVHMVVLPLVSLALQFTLLDSAIEQSRARAIRNAAEMIAHIEEYRAARGRYPVSMQALHGDYLPGTVGTMEFRFEPTGDAYNVYFEHPAKAFGTQEIVMYNPRDEHVFTSHASDIIRRSPAELELRRGFYERRDAPQPHWKYFWFD